MKPGEWNRYPQDVNNRNNRTSLNYNKQILLIWQGKNQIRQNIFVCNTVAFFIYL